MHRLRDLPGVTRGLLVTIVAVFAAQQVIALLLGGDIVGFVGRKDNAAIAAGQWWRLVTPMFLHVDALHLLFNGYALYVLGPQIETAFGTARMLAVYLLSGAAGTVVSFVLSPHPAVGASGAIFGLFGALAVHLYRHRALLGPAGRDVLRQLAVVAAINLVISLSPGIDGWGHLGGVVCGALLAALIGPRLVLGYGPIGSEWGGAVSAHPTGLRRILADTHPAAARDWWIVLAVAAGLVAAVAAEIGWGG